MIYAFESAVMCVCALAGLVYGIRNFFRKKSGLLNKIASLSLGSFAAAHLYLATEGFVFGCVRADTFVIAVIGGIMFLISFSFGKFDEFVDDSGRMSIKAMAMLMPAFYLLFGIAAANTFGAERGEGVPASAPFYLMIILFAAFESYFAFKHLLISGDENSLAFFLRRYNVRILSILWSFLIWNLAREEGNVVVSAVMTVIVAENYINILPSLKKGMEDFVR